MKIVALIVLSAVMMFGQQGATVGQNMFHADVEQLTKDIKDGQPAFIIEKDYMLIKLVAGVMDCELTEAKIVKLNTEHPGSRADVADLCKEAAEYHDKVAAIITKVRWKQ